MRRTDGLAPACCWRPSPTARPLVARRCHADAPLSAQERPRHGRLFPPEDLGLLEGPDRDAWQKPDPIMDALGSPTASAVADIGAGGGWFTVRLARRVGPNGSSTRRTSRRRCSRPSSGASIAKGSRTCAPC